jgi:hypothetical protein
VANLKWIKGSGVDRDGHNLAWWKNKAKTWSRSEYDRPKVYIGVETFDRAGQRAKGKEFGVDELKEAKAFAKSWLEETGGTAQVVGRVDIPYQGGKSWEIGEYRNAGSDGFYVWSVDKSGMPFTRRGPFADPDEALRDARDTSKTGQTYDYIVTFGSDPEASDFEVVKAFKAWSGEVYYSSELPRVGSRLKEYRENSGSYYVWVIGSNNQPLDEGPFGPHDLEGAKTFARISATKGAHDRAVSRGVDPKASSFEIVRRYRAGSGERVL